ncbi:MAG: hypothetical protein AAB578_07115 [Elusimicrobiota bacterium]
MNGEGKKAAGRPLWRGAFSRRSRGQTVVEYMLMTVMLLALFTGLYKALQTSMKNAFVRAGIMILRAYY